MPIHPRGRAAHNTKIRLEKVDIHALHLEPKLGHPYIEIVSDHEIIHVRVTNTDVHEWLKEHKDDLIDLTIFPYQWSAGEKRGIVYTFQHAEVHKGE